MTILPKKKHVENKKNEQEFEGDARHRSRARSARERQRQVDEANSTGNECGTSPNLQTNSVFEHGDLEKRENHEGIMPRYKRIRQRPSSNAPYFSSESRRSNRSPPSDEPEQTGYNSSDEHVPAQSVPNIEKKEREFEKQLNEKKGYIIKSMAQDGACLFRAVADQVYGDQEMHSVVRRHCMDYMVKNADHFSAYVTEDFSSYIRRKRIDSCHGNHLEIQALSEMYNRRIEVYVYSFEPINTFFSPSCKTSDDPPIRVSYHGNVHYNSIIDPYNPSVGVGLGLAGYNPKQDDNRLVDTAMRQSEDVILEKEMLQDKLLATDWEATDEAMAELVARESYLQWLRESQKKSTSVSSVGGCSSRDGCSSSQSCQSPPSRASPAPYSTAAYSPVQFTKTHSSPPTSSTFLNGKRLPYRGSESNSVACSTLSNTAQWEDYSTNRVASDEHDDWDEDRYLAAVLARSEQEYYDDLRREPTSSPQARNK